MPPVQPGQTWRRRDRRAFQVLELRSDPKGRARVRLGLPEGGVHETSLISLRRHYRLEQGTLGL